MCLGSDSRPGVTGAMLRAFIMSGRKPLSNAVISSNQKTLAQAGSKSMCEWHGNPK
jgi:hypothetical protein